MALVQVNFISQSLKRTVSMNVILPVDKFLFKGNCQPVKEYKTLYLLHGLLGNYTDWVTRTRIQEWAEAKNLVVVMPSGDNSFYVDQEVKNNDFGIFIGTELIEVTRRMFHFRTFNGWIWCSKKWVEILSKFWIYCSFIKCSKYFRITSSR